MCLALFHAEMTASRPVSLGWTNTIHTPGGMEMKGYTVRFAAIAAVFALGACDNALTSTGEMSEAEATELAGVIMENVMSNSSTPPAMVDGPQLVPFTSNTSVAYTAECPQGGTLAIMGDASISGDTETEELEVGYTVTHTHNACTAMGEDGSLFTLTGNPDLELDMSVELVEGVVSWDGSIEGAIDWVTDGREGTCVVDYTFEGTATPEQSASASVTGSVCGFTVSHSFTVGT